MTTKTIEHHVLSCLIGDVESNCKKLLDDGWELSGVEGVNYLQPGEEDMRHTDDTVQAETIRAILIFSTSMLLGYVFTMMFAR